MAAGPGRRSAAACVCATRRSCTSRRASGGSSRRFTSLWASTRRATRTRCARQTTRLSHPHPRPSPRPHPRALRARHCCDTNAQVVQVLHRQERIACRIGANDRDCWVGRRLPRNGRPERRVQGARRHGSLRLRHVPEHIVRQLLVCAVLSTHLICILHTICSK